MSEHRCPIPICRKRLTKHEVFMCGTHEKIIPPVLLAAVLKTTKALQGNPSGPARDPAVHDYRMARALAFAAVCDQLGIDAEALIQKAVHSDAPPAEALSIAAAVRRELNR
jgi:hypothetical protein